LIYQYEEVKKYGTPQIKSPPKTIKITSHVRWKNPGSSKAGFLFL